MTIIFEREEVESTLAQLDTSENLRVIKVLKQLIKIIEDDPTVGIVDALLFAGNVHEDYTLRIASYEASREVYHVLEKAIPYDEYSRYWDKDTLPYHVDEVLVILYEFLNSVAFTSELDRQWLQNRTEEVASKMDDPLLRRAYRRALQNIEFYALSLITDYGY